jgi:hypothetical protein
VIDLLASWFLRSIALSLADPGFQEDCWSQGKERGIHPTEQIAAPQAVSVVSRIQPMKKNWHPTKSRIFP